ELEILQALAGRVGLGEAMAGSAQAWKERLIAPTLGRHGLSLASLPLRNPDAPRVLFADRKFATASGRVNLVTGRAVPDAAIAPAVAPAEFPLLLVGLSTDRAQSSQWSRK